MKSHFTAASAYIFAPEPQDVLLVTINSGAVLTAETLPRYLVTSHTNVCTGMALTSKDENVSALTHIYSDMKYFPEGRKRVEDYARFAWQKFQDRLPEVTFNAIAFGGQDSFPGYSEKYPGAKLIDTYLKKSAQAEREYSEIETSPEFLKLSDTIRNFHEQERKDPLTLTENIELAFMEKRLGEMLSEPYDDLNKGKFLHAGLYMAAKVSTWLGHEFYNSALNSGRLETCKDLRFFQTPHDVILDHKESQIIIGRTEKDSPLPNPYNRGYAEADKLFEGYALQR